jgi:hypothetical protein
MAEQYGIILAAPLELSSHDCSTLAVLAHEARKRWPGRKVFNPSILPRDREIRWQLRQRGNAMLDAPADAIVIIHTLWSAMPSIDAQRALARAIGLKVVEI